MNAIEFSDFSCYYKQNKELIPALCNLNLTIANGEFVAIVGESGAGKSTLLKACLGIADAFEGELMLDETDAEHLDLKTANHAYVSQEIALYPNLTVYENIAFPLRVVHTPQAQVDARVKEIADIFEIRFLLTRKPKLLSAGQQQRVAIARALIKNPTHIYFDEPFANLDIMLRREMRVLVTRLHQKYRPTILFVTHDLPEAFAIAQRVVVLEEGRIVDDGSLAELRENAKSQLLKGFFGYDANNNWNV